MNEPALMKLAEAARQIGVAPVTIERHPSDFFAVQRLGRTKYVLRSDYNRWLQSKAPAIAGTPIPA